jgi:hypothetical protein
MYATPLQMYITRDDSVKLPLFEGNLRSACQRRNERAIVAVQCRPDRQSAVAVTEAKIVSQPVEE